MKKLVTMMLGLGLILGTTAFAQETKTEQPKKEKKAKKPKKETKTTTEEKK